MFKMAGFNKKEMTLIYEDQKTALDSIHYRNYDQCGKYEECPVWHFDQKEMDVETISLRQAMMKKVNAFVGRARG